MDMAERQGELKHEREERQPCAEPPRRPASTHHACPVGGTTTGRRRSIVL
jgi:hypothetical protein